MAKKKLYRKPQGFDFDHFISIKKGSVDRFRELFHAISIIKDCQDQVARFGKYYQISVLYGQMRSLLIDRRTDPLLFVVAKILNEPLRVYYFNNKLSLPIKDLLFHLRSGFISTFQSSPKQHQTTIDVFLKEKVLFYKGQDIRTETIIEHLANAYGGSHYSHEGKNYLNEIIYTDLMRAGLNDFIMQLAETVRALGTLLLQTITALDLYLGVYIPDQDTSNGICIFSFSIPNSLVMYRLILINNVFRLQGVDVNGISMDLQASQIFNLNQLFDMNISFRFDNNMNGIVLVTINNETVINQVLQIPMLFINNLPLYELLINKPQGEVPEYNAEFGLSYITGYGRILNDDEHLGLRDYFSKKEIRKIVYFEKGGYGIKKIGNRSVEMFGRVIEKDVDELIK